MKIIASRTLRNDYSLVAEQAHATGEPIFVTRNGESDLVVMSQEAFDARNAELSIRAKVLEAEAHKLDGAKAYSIGECREMLVHSQEFVM